MDGDEYRAALDGLDLMQELRRLFAGQRRADGLICRYIADLQENMGKLPSLMVYGTIFELVRAKFGLSLRSVRERLRVGRALRMLPELNAALSSGRLTYSRVREVTRVATPETEHYWLAAASQLSIRALERSVIQARGGVPLRSRPRPSPTQTRPGVPEGVQALLQQAMDAARDALGHDLSDAEALAAVARGALAHFGGSSADVPPTEVAATHSGSPEASRESQTQLDDSETHHSGSPRFGSARRRGLDEGEPTHSGSRAVAGGQERDEAQALDGRSTSDAEQPNGAGNADPIALLSPDAQVLFDRFRAQRAWHMSTLCDVTGIPPNRFACALHDLLLLRLVKPSSFGVFELDLKRLGTRQPSQP